jgi:small GTP-binding protein
MSLGLYDCYVDSKFTNEVNIAERYFNPVNIVEASGVILLPNYNSTGVDDVNCRELLFGKNSWNGILGLSGNLRALSESERKNVVEKLQYTPKESSGSRKCFSMTVSWAMVDKDKRGSATSNEVCADVESDGNTMTTTFQTIGREFEQCPVGTPCIFANAIGNSLNIVMQVGSGDYGRFENTFNINQPATVGLEHHNLMIKINSYILRMQIWDTAVQEKFDSIATTYYKSTDVVIFVYAVNLKSSFDRITDWVKQVEDNSSKDEEQLRILIGNKTDLDSERKVSTDEGKALADKIGCSNFIEISCLEKGDDANNSKIDSIIDIVARKFYHLYKVSKSERLNSSSFNYIASESILINNGPHNKKKCNC